MLALLQRVAYAKVEVEKHCIATIEKGILMLCGFEPNDNTEIITKRLEKCLNYRLFSDPQGKMNLSLKSLGLSLLIVPQFTLAADTRSGLRPSFSTAAPPLLGKKLFDQLCGIAKTHYPNVCFGEFGANMQVTLCNDGPVTFMLDK